GNVSGVCSSDLTGSHTLYSAEGECALVSGVSGGVVRRLPPSGEQDALALGAVEGVATGVPFLVAAAPAVLAGAPGGDRVGGPVLTAVVHEVREAFGGLGGGEIGRAHV